MEKKRFLVVHPYSRRFLQSSLPENRGFESRNGTGGEVLSRSLAFEDSVRLVWIAIGATFIHESLRILIPREL